jgi:hypothetical protein
MCAIPLPEGAARVWTKPPDSRHFPPALKILCHDFNGLYDFGKNRLSTPFAASRILAVIALAGTWCAPGIREGGGDLPPCGSVRMAPRARHRPAPGGACPEYIKGHGEPGAEKPRRLVYGKNVERAL